MSRCITMGLGLALSVSTAVAGGQITPDSASPADEYKALVEACEQEGQPRRFAGRFIQLAEAHPRSPVAVEALVWVLTEVRRRPEAVRALELLTKDHVQSRDLGSACVLIANTPSPKAETLLRAVLEKNPHREVRAEACRRLASLFEQQELLVEELRKQPELTNRVLRYYGREYGQHLVSLDSDKLLRRREELYERMLKSFREVKTPNGTLGAIAEAGLFKIRHLSIGRVAPEITGEDIFGKEFKLSDYRGKVVVLSFWGHW